MQIEFALDFGTNKQRFDLGSKQKGVCGLSVEQRPDTDSVPRKEELASSRVPYRKCPLPIEVADTVFSLFLVQVQYDFGVRTGGELVPFLHKRILELDIIEDFAVEGNPEFTVRSGHRLATALDVDDAQA